MLVELGGGTSPHRRAGVVIDTRHPRNAPRQDVAHSPWLHTVGGVPVRIDSGSVDEVYASHLMEHIPKGQATIDVLNEAWRILKPGGAFTMLMPVIGYSDPATGDGRMVANWRPYADPTHVQGWWLPESLLYFSHDQFIPAADYGIRQWVDLGPWRDPADVSSALEYSEVRPWDPSTPSTLHGERSWWTVRGGWEGVARLIKP